jgi:hypothetical protein
MRRLVHAIATPVIASLLLVSAAPTLAVEPDPNYTEMLYTALPAPCRILDTRQYSDAAHPLNAGEAREVFSYDIAAQGGDATCAAALLGKPTLMLALTAVSPAFPAKMPAMGYATLLNGSAMSSGWSEGTPLASGHSTFSYDTPPYNAAATIVWDQDTRLITTLAVVASQSASPNVVLYSAGPAHFTLDVVGYYEPLVP